MPRDRDKVTLEKDLQDNLRCVYRKKVEDDVPEKLLNLIQRLRDENTEEEDR